MQPIDTTALVQWLNSQLNSTDNNPYGIVFEISENVGNMPRPGGGFEPTDFSVPGVLIEGPAQYQPLQKILAINVPFSLHIEAFRGGEADGLPPFTFEQTKEIVDKVFINANGTYITIGTATVLVTGATSFVGDVNIENSYDRIPLDVSFVGTVTSSGVFSNTLVIKIDNHDLEVLSFTATKQKSGESQTLFNTATGKTINSQQVRVFSGSCYMQQNTSLASIFDGELADDTTQNATHTLLYKGKTYTVAFQAISDILQVGTLALVEFTLAEYPTQNVNNNPGTGGDGTFPGLGDTTTPA